LPDGRLMSRFTFFLLYLAPVSIPQLIENCTFGISNAFTAVFKAVSLITETHITRLNLLMMLKNIGSRNILKCRVYCYTWMEQLSLTSAQRIIERDHIVDPGEVKKDQSLLGAIQGTLRIQNAQIAVNSLDITGIGKAAGFRRSIDH